ncbi:CRE-LIR-2 protein [Caenorhabditis remanei]|uniref:CRE-LIR-2 protein n=1 Tax=Caenorhabditis remanei TaxID=31234 RepID=E3LRP8_CAERE|nr:CRE-LIR-2 protein [Caenorhabditis remanei]
MLTNAGPRTAKISRDVSNFIITQVLERSDDLIKNSYRRLTTENVARNEHWSRIAEKVTEKFDIPAEMERVKSHFHNRKKVLLARIKDELKLIQNSCVMTTDEKIEELVKRRICIGEYDEQLARVCLDIEDEEKGRTDQFGNDQFMQQPTMNLFTETTHQSLLCQLLSSSGPQPTADKPALNLSSMESASASSRDSDVPVSIPIPTTMASTRAPLLSKLLCDPSTSKENSFSKNSEDSKVNRPPSGVRNMPVLFPERKRRAASPIEKNNLSSVLPSPNGQYLSHLIVDITSPQELKKLLSVLIDNGFSRFQHVATSDMVASSIEAGIQRASRIRNFENNETRHEDQFDRDETLFWPTRNPENGSLTVSPDMRSDVMDSIKNRVERVDVEVKLEPCTDEDDEYEEEVDEQTAQLEAQLASEALQTGLALFGKSPSPKKMRSDHSASSSWSDIVTATCEMCGTVIRLNSGGSKWNFYEHVMMKHSKHKPYKCPLCPYQTGRKVRVKQHALSQHNTEIEPVDMITPEIRSEWLNTMSKCFPDHQYGKSTRI